MEAAGLEPRRGKGSFASPLPANRHHSIATFRVRLAASAEILEPPLELLERGKVGCGFRLRKGKRVLLQHGAPPAPGLLHPVHIRSPPGTGRPFAGDAPERRSPPFSGASTAGCRTGSCLYFTPVPKGEKSQGRRISAGTYVVGMNRYLFRCPGRPSRAAEGWTIAVVPLHRKTTMERTEPISTT